MIHQEAHDHVTVLRMEHGKVNALDLELCEALAEKLQALESADARAVVLTGTGGSFSAGVDLFRLLNEGKPYLDQFLPAFEEMLLALFRFAKPVVAALNGHAIAGGCILACACDYRLVAEGDARLGVPELLVGVPFPALPLEMLRSVVTPSALQRLVYTGQTVGTEAARAVGLVDEIVPPDELPAKALARARQLAAIPPDTFALTKRTLRQPVLERVEQLKTEIDPQVAAVWAAPETHAVIRAYLEKTFGKK